MSQETNFVPENMALDLKHQPAARKSFWKNSYDQTASTIGDERFVFMNLGYADTSSQPEDIQALGFQYYFENLYRHVVGGVNLRDKRVLEVGCGRGGGSRFLMETYQPERLTAVDISEVAITRCDEVHKVEGLSFQAADAEDLPFENAVFDGVINVESSHCYGSRDTFLAEVNRVLRPGGVFMFADLFIAETDPLAMDEMDALLERAGFITLTKTDITRHVLTARDLVSDFPHFREMLKKWAPEGERGATREAFFLKGTRTYSGLKRGTTKYGSWLLRKPD